MSIPLTPEEAELNSLETAFSAAWDATNTPVVFGDDAFKGERTKPWVRFSVLPGEGTRADLGGTTTRYEFTGVITVQCFIPQSEPTSPQWLAAQYTQAVRDIFQDKQFVTVNNGHIICYATSYRRVPPEASWQRYNILTPFKRYEVM